MAKTARKKTAPLSDAIKAAEKKTPALKVKRIGTPRLIKALKATLLVGNMARYKPTAAQSAYFVNQLKAAVNTVERQFAGAPEAKVQVSLPDA